MSVGRNYTACIVTTRFELENAVENRKHVIVCRGEIYDDLKESGFVEKVKKYRTSKKQTIALGVGTTILSGPIALIALGGTLLSGFNAYFKGKADDLKNFKYYNINLDMLENQIVFFYKDYNYNKDTYHE